MAFITIAGQNQIAKKQGENATLNINKFVMANVPNLGSEPATRIENIPNAYVVDQLNVTKSGYVNTNQVVYSLVMGSNVGDYQFNWVGLVDDEGVLIAVTYIPLTTKTKNNGGVPGNTFTRNFLLSYTGIQQTTSINVPAETWQIDFSARLSGIDERERLSNLDIYGHEGFLNDGWKVTGSAGTYSVAEGIGYVGGIRAKNTAPQEITTATFPNEIWLNVSLQGDISDMTAVSEFVIDTGPVADYVDGNGIEHYLTKIADIASDGAVVDERVIYDPRDASRLNKGVVAIERLPVTSGPTDVAQGKLLKVEERNFTTSFSVTLPESVTRRYMDIELPSVSRSLIVKVLAIAKQGQQLSTGGFEAVYVLSRTGALSVDTLYCSEVTGASRIGLAEPIIDGNIVHFGLRRGNNGTSTNASVHFKVEVLCEARGDFNLTYSDGSVSHSYVEHSNKILHSGNTGNAVGYDVVSSAYDTDDQKLLSVGSQGIGTNFKLVGVDGNISNQWYKLCDISNFYQKTRLEIVGGKFSSVGRGSTIFVEIGGVSVSDENKIKAFSINGQDLPFSVFRLVGSGVYALGASSPSLAVITSTSTGNVLTPDLKAVSDPGGISVGVSKLFSSDDVATVSDIFAGISASKLATAKGLKDAGITDLVASQFGVEQSVQFFTSPDRVSGVEYTNTTDRPRFVNVIFGDSNGGTAVADIVNDGVNIVPSVAYDGGQSAGVFPASFFVLPGKKYKCTVTGPAIIAWSEI